MQNRPPINVSSFLTDLFHHAARLNRGPVMTKGIQALVTEEMTVPVASLRSALLVCAVNNQRDANDIRRLLGAPGECPTAANAFELLAGHLASPESTLKQAKEPVQKQLMAASRQLTTSLKEIVGDGHDGNKSYRTFFRVLFSEKETAHAVLRAFVNITGAATSTKYIPDVKALTEILMQDYR